MNVSRELTRNERTAIRKLVTTMCANYDYEYGCLPLDCPCVMLNKAWTGAYCRYFRNAVLPTNPALEAALTGKVLKMRPCSACGTPFPASGRKTYCSAVCAEKAHRGQKRDSIRRKRGGLM
jgi:predicted nucleic acid-binding Zn ribbon protein